jgi:hypothetical protein
MTQHEYDIGNQASHINISKLGYLFFKEPLLSNQTDRYGGNGNATY